MTDREEETAEEEEDEEDEEEEGGGGGAGNADLEEFGKDLEEEFAEEEEEAAEAAAVAARAAASRKNANPNRKHKVVKRTVYFNNPDGTRWKRVELITDFKKVQQYVRSKKSEHKGRLVRAENHEKRKDQLAQARAKRKIHKEAKSDEQQKADDIKDAQQKLAHFQIYQDWVAKGSDKKNLPHIGTGNSGKGAKSCSICACTGDAWTGIRRDGSSHLGLLLTGPNHLAPLCTGHMRTNKICPLYDEEVSGRVDRRYRQKKERDPKAAAEGESWLTAATPVDNPYCSCKLTRVRRHPDHDDQADGAVDQAQVHRGPGQGGHGGQGGQAQADPVHGRPLLLQAKVRTAPQSRRP